MLNGFLSLSLDLVLLSTIFLILTVGNPSSADGSSGLATTVCQALSSSVSGATSLPVPFSIGLPDLLGLSLEACEEQFEGVLVSALGALAIVEGARAWVAVRILGYYALLVRSRMPSSARTARGGDEFYDSPVELEGTAAPRSGLFRSPSSRSSSSASTMTPHTKKKRRGSHGEAAHASAGSASDRLSKPRERERSGSLRAGDHKKRSSGDESTRIFLLPRSEERGPATAAAAAAMSQREQEVPLLTLTTSSPVSSTFPPMRHHQSGPPNPPGGSRDVDAGPRRVLVYAPVSMRQNSLLAHTTPADGFLAGSLGLCVTGGSPLAGCEGSRPWTPPPPPPPVPPTWRFSSAIVFFFRLRLFAPATARELVVISSPCFGDARTDDAGPVSLVDDHARLCLLELELELGRDDTSAGCHDSHRWVHQQQLSFPRQDEFSPADFGLAQRRNIHVAIAVHAGAQD